MTSFALKIIALISMVIDHTGHVIFPQYRWLRYIGRLAFPIYAFLIVEGYVHTRDVRKYLIRLGVFALISEIPFDMAFEGAVFTMKGQNVYFTLFLGLLAVVLIDRFVFHTWLQFVLVAVIAVTAQLMHTDYRFIGVCLIVVMYLYRDRLVFRTAGALNALIPFSSRIEFMACFSLLPIQLYNGKQGRFKWKYFFYIVYPAHLMVLVVIRRVIYGIWI
ncbi:MAG: hypothetical protein J5829_04385 [Lachnospiraceae bacterium]|nr:hypothetical protein [Lachnospiraceae bacterium]